MEEGILVEGHLNVYEIGEEASSGVVFALMLHPRPVDTQPSRKRLLDRVLLSTYVSL